MATTYWFHDTTESTGPTSTASGLTDRWTGSPADKWTLRVMNTTQGTSQTSAAGSNWACTTSGYDGLLRVFVGPALAAGTLTGSQAGFQVGFALMESNAQMNLYGQFFVYVWRSGTGNAKTIGGPTVTTNGDDTVETGLVTTFTGASGDFTITLNDRVVVEIWGDNQNTKNTNYTATLYYDGATQVVDNTATSDAGSYFYSPQTLEEPAGAGQPYQKRWGGVPGAGIIQGALSIPSHKIY